MDHLPERGEAAHPPAPDLAARLAELTAREAPVERPPVEQLQGLVAALVDQLAAGQVETLYSLHTASTTLARRSEELATLAADLSGQITAQVTAQVTEQLTALVTERFSAAESLLAGASAAMEERVRHAESLLLQATAAMDARLASAELTLATTKGGVDAATAGLSAAAAQAHGDLARTTQETSRDINSLVDELAAVAGQTLDGVQLAGQVVVSALNDRVETFLQALTEARDHTAEHSADLEQTLEARVARLVSRTDAAVVRLAERLKAETDRLALRDEVQEELRAAAFVTVLEDLLARAGGRRALRDRVRDVLAQERTAPPPPAQHQPPVAPPPTKAPAKRPAPRKAAATPPPTARKRTPRSKEDSP